MPVIEVFEVVMQALLLETCPMVSVTTQRLKLASRPTIHGLVLVTIAWIPSALQWVSWALSLMR